MIERWSDVKVRSKLACIMICLIILPIVFLDISTSNTFSKYMEQNFRENVGSVSKIQSDNIAMSVEGQMSCAKTVSANDRIRNYTQYTNLTYDERTQRDNTTSGSEADYIHVQAAVVNVEKLNPEIDEAFIVNNFDVVIASSEPASVNNEIASNEFVDIIDNGGGVSSIRTENIGSWSGPVYYIARNIYSSDNIKQGMYIQRCNVSYMQRVIASTKAFKTAYVLVLDSYGSVLEYPYLNVNNYSEISGYQKIHNFFGAAIGASNDGSGANSSKFTTAKINGQEQSVYAQAIPGVKWTLVTIVNNHEIYDGGRGQISQIFLASFYIFAVLVAAIAFAVMWFVKPINNILDVVTRKQRGDQSARFEKNGNDEFGKIGFAFNSMFDDVFESEQRYRTIVEMTDNIVFEINLKKNNVYISNNFNQKFSFRAKSNSLSESFFYKGRVHKDDRERYLADFGRILGNANYLQGEYRFKNIYSDFAWVMIRATKFFDRDEKPTKVIGVIVDIDREKKSEMHLIARASLDALTQLYNRETFIKMLAKEFDLAANRKTLDAVLFIDLDDFKHFNDEYGHACGDEVLKYTADSLKEIVSDRGFAGRFGGDEFVVCLRDQKYFRDPSVAAQEIINALAKGFVSEASEQIISINCSIGIAFFSENGKNCEEVLSAADEAMYGVKRHGKSNFGYAQSGIKHADEELLSEEEVIESEENQS